METTNGKTSGVRTLGVKIDDNLHAQFSLVAQLDDLSLNDAVKKAVELYVETKQKAPDFATRAQAVLEEIEREAATRRGAIQALFGGAVPSEEAKSAKAVAKKAGADTSA
jgi:hypothetical protein